jgi:hypothetical protein
VSGVDLVVAVPAAVAQAKWSKSGARRRWPRTGSRSAPGSQRSTLRFGACPWRLEIRCRAAPWSQSVWVGGSSRGHHGVWCGAWRGRSTMVGRMISQLAELWCVEEVEWVARLRRPFCRAAGPERGGLSAADIAAAVRPFRVSLRPGPNRMAGIASVGRARALWRPGRVAAWADWILRSRVPRTAAPPGRRGAAVVAARGTGLRTRAARGRARCSPPRSRDAAGRGGRQYEPAHHGVEAGFRAAGPSHLLAVCGEKARQTRVLPDHITCAADRRYCEHFTAVRGHAHASTALNVL